MLIPAIVLQSLLFPRDVKFHPHDHRGLLALDILHDRNYLGHALIDFSNQGIFLWQFARVRDKNDLYFAGRSAHSDHQSPQDAAVFLSS